MGGYAMTNCDRVRANTNPKINDKIDEALREHIRFYSTQTLETIDARLAELDREWDIERVLFVQASMFGFAGLTLGILKGKRFLAIPAIVLPFLFLHGVQGWC